MPHTPDGQPDLQGVWDTASLTPLERPAELGGKQFFTQDEASAYEKKQNQEQNRDRRDGGHETDAGRAYNEAWFDRGTKVAENLRTSLIVDPPDGRIPPMTAEAEKKFERVHAWIAEHPADGPEDLALHVRCLTFSQTGPPMLPSAYNNNYQILQNPRLCVDSRRNGNYGAYHPSRWASASTQERFSVDGRLARSLGERHSCRGYDELEIQ